MLNAYPEAKAFAQEALAETKLPFAPNPDSDAAARISSLSHSIIQQSYKLRNLLEEDVSTVEQRYSELSCSVSEYRFLRSLAAPVSSPEPESEPRLKRQRLDSVQRLPNELVLRSLQFCEVRMFDSQNRHFRVFPRLSRSTHQLSLSSPDCLGVLRVNQRQFARLHRKPKPCYVSCIDAEFGSYWLCFLISPLLQKSLFLIQKSIAHGIMHSIVSPSNVACKN